LQEEWNLQLVSAIAAGLSTASRLPAAVSEVRVATNEELARIHERLDDLFKESGEVRAAVQRIEERCGTCRKMVDHHQEVLHGNGKAGLVERMGAAETGRTDTLSVKSTISLVGAIGALAGAIGAAMASLIK
jgi:hypothetical protein